MTDNFPNTVDFDINDFTPAMRQFVDVKRRYPAMLVLFRMGDFYETFFEDARKANRLIGITLTKRGRLRDGTEIPMSLISAVILIHLTFLILSSGRCSISDPMMSMVLPSYANLNTLPGLGTILSVPADSMVNVFFVSSTTLPDISEYGADSTSTSNPMSSVLMKRVSFILPLCGIPFPPGRP